MQEPYVLGGEDIGSLYYAFRNHLRQLGDAQFALQLSRCPPERIAAVSYFIEERTFDRCPRTKAVLTGAPAIQFPAAKITEEDARRP